MAGQICWIHKETWILLFCYSHFESSLCCIHCYGRVCHCNYSVVLGCCAAARRVSQIVQSSWDALRNGYNIPTTDSHSHSYNYNDNRRMTYDRRCPPLSKHFTYLFRKCSFTLMSLSSKIETISRDYLGLCG